MIFDGDCGFCRTWIARWKESTGDRVAYAPSQEVASRFPEIPPEVFARAVVLALPNGRVYEGAEAVARSLAAVPGHGAFLWVYRFVPGAAACAELAYRVIASHRTAALVVTRLLWGDSVAKPTYFAATALFLRLLGLSYFVAFLSLWGQIDGLVGSRGVLPVAQYLDWIRATTRAAGYWLVPTLCWLSSTDGFLHLLCGAGALAGLLLLAGIAPVASAATAWLLYLSLSIAGQVFLEFQWDILLLEAGLIAILVASPRTWRFRSGLAASGLALFLLRWLLFRLVFSSGWVKLASGDPTWRNLTALRFHYETQPLPPWTAWFMHQLPPSFQTVSVLFIFFVELVVPLLFFAPRRVRLFAFRMTLLLQILMEATGNYAFFNLLAVALAVLLLDDLSFPRRWREAAKASAISFRRGWPKGILVPVAAVLFLASSIAFSATLFRSFSPPEPLVAIVRWIGPFRSVNGYGLFAVMTTSRPEIVIEGSDDGAVWRVYEFRWKPGNPRRRPAFVAPHQPRLDWQMWFAALGSYRENPWLIRLLARLLEGSPEVEGLLARNPFPDHPPRFVRAVLYDYHFTDSAERRSTGAWWRRELKGLYCPVLSRENVRLLE
jgi:predicted DCC family thiol-disulfide oxidoreductase YuxK